MRRSPSAGVGARVHMCRVGGSTRVHPARRVLGASGRHRSPPSEGARWRRTRAGVTTGASPLRWRRRLGPELAHHPRNTPPLAPTIARDLSRGAAETDVHMLYFAQSRCCVLARVRSVHRGMGSEDLAEYAVVSSRLLLYLVEPVRVVRRCMRVGFPRIMQRLICCCRLRTSHDVEPSLSLIHISEPTRPY